MKIVPIFVDNKSCEGLYSIQYQGQKVDEFERLLDTWNDADYLFEYLKTNLKYLQVPYFEGITIEDARVKIQEEAFELEHLLREYCKRKFDKSAKNLQMLFLPLDGREYRILPKQANKLRVTSSNFRKPLLRIYAIRISVTTFVITGGAIKLSHRMKDHEDTRIELQKLQQVKSFLNANQINSVDDIIYYYEEP